MDPTNEAASSGGDQAPIAAPVAVHRAGGSGALSLREATNSVVDWRRKGATDQSQSDASATAATPANESAVEAGAAPPVAEAHGETQVTDPQANEPAPIEPPKSWTKDAKDRWASLPRETQDYIASREQERDREVRRSQNETAEQRKAIETERAHVVQARQQYEQALPVLLQNLQAQAAGDFADIKTMEDLQRLAADDPFRFAQYQVAERKIAAVHQEAAASQQRQQQEFHTRLSTYMQTEAERFAELAPEVNDPAALDKLQKSAVSMLKDLGFKDDELGGFWRGDAGVSIHDHRLQLVLRDAVKYREAQAAAKKIAQQARPVPPVQRPGAAPNQGAQREATLRNLNQQIDQSTGANQLRAAAKLLRERRATT